MIIDCHCHAGTGDGLTGPWDTAAPLARHLRRAARAGIERTVIFAAFHSDYASANEEVARMVASRPNRLYGFAFVNAARDRGRVLDLVRVAVQQYGFVGIKVHRHDARITREVCGAARALGSPCSTTSWERPRSSSSWRRSTRMSTSSCRTSGVLRTTGARSSA